jgi:hypothetical protein
MAIATARPLGMVDAGGDNASYFNDLEGAGDFRVAMVFE